ncbi:MAG: VOC family protein [Gammaproteobacteria bacterium]
MLLIDRDLEWKMTPDSSLSVDGSIWTRVPERPATIARPFVRLKVKELSASIPFYERMFAQPATELSRGTYARFEVMDPPLNLLSIEAEDAFSYEGHMGIQMKQMADVNRYRARMEEGGIEIFVTETEVACCYSVQNKAWVRDPDNNSWEFFMVVEKNITEGCGDVCACKGCGDFE